MPMTCVWTSGSVDEIQVERGFLTSSSLARLMSRATSAIWRRRVGAGASVLLSLIGNGNIRTRSRSKESRFPSRQ